MNHVHAHVLSAIPALRCSMERAQAEASGPGGRTGGDTTGTSVTDRRAREVRTRRAQAEASGPGGRTGGDKTGTSLSLTGARAKCARGALKPKRAAPKDGTGSEVLPGSCREPNEQSLPLSMVPREHLSRLTKVANRAPCRSAVDVANAGQRKNGGMSISRGDPHAARMIMPHLTTTVVT
jgi:hypothetical protein